jgi:hypothetical protein
MPISTIITDKSDAIATRAGGSTLRKYARTGSATTAKAIQRRVRRVMKEGEYSNGGCSFQDKPRIQDKRFAANAAKKTRNGTFSI